MTACRRAGRARRTLAPCVVLLVAALAVSACALFEGAREERRERNRPLRQVTPPVAFEMLRDASELSVVDLRSHAEFHGPLGHIHGALNVPAEDLDRRMREISYLRSRTFLVYCRQQCERPLLERLARAGFVDAMVLHGGLEAWIGDGFGTVGAGGDAASHDDKVRGIAGNPG
jgi:rhodanese-related sulfurtransferase